MIYDSDGQVVQGARVDWATMEWTPEILAHIPDEVMLSERQRRRARLRTTYTGGLYWEKHNPETSRCRCKDCMQRRKLEAKAAAKVKTKKKGITSATA